MWVKGHNLEIDILEELQEFDWSNEAVKGIKFIACSPFRHERHPSFAVNIETGTFIDSGNDDDYYRKGSFIKLLSILRCEDQEEVENYLIEKYTKLLRDTDALRLKIKLPENKKQDLPVIDPASIEHLYSERSDYLTKRGISQEVQNYFGTGFNPQNGTVALIWTDKKGQIINVKYRIIKKKTFFYEKDKQLIGNHVYGMYQCIQQGAKRVFLCESEIDALTFWTYGYPAIALGGSSLTDKQAKIILSAGIEELVIATDNDKVGNKLADVLLEEFIGHFRVYRFPFPDGVKDINDMTKEQIDHAVNILKEPSISFLE